MHRSERRTIRTLAEAPKAQKHYKQRRYQRRTRRFDVMLLFFFALMTSFSRCLEDFHTWRQRRCEYTVHQHIVHICTASIFSGSAAKHLTTNHHSSYMSFFSTDHRIGVQIQRLVRMTQMVTYVYGINTCTQTTPTSNNFTDNKVASKSRPSSPEV